MTIITIIKNKINFKKILKIQKNEKSKGSHILCPFPNVLVFFILNLCN